MLERLRFLFFKRALQHALADHRRQRKSYTLQTARTIGLLFDATSEKTRQEVKQYVQEIEKGSKQVRLLGYFKTKELPGQHPFDFFFQKEITWTGRPKSEKAAAFLQEKFDLLLCFNPNDERPLEWISTLSPAAMKIGLATNRPHELDIQIEIPSDKGLRYFADQLHLYSAKIVLTKNEPVRAI